MQRKSRKMEREGRKDETIKSTKANIEINPNILIALQ